jgi:hypothetical protein
MRNVALFICGAALLGCGAEGGSVEGRWTGQIVCLGDTGDLTLGLNLGESTAQKVRSLYGTAQIRIKDSNAFYDVKGELDLEVARLLECKNPTCQVKADCAESLDNRDSKGASCDPTQDPSDPRGCQTGKSDCVEGLCTPCYTREQWSQVVITLRSTNVQLPTPTLELWRYGDTRMEGTIKLFCPDESIQRPQVLLSKS